MVECFHTQQCKYVHNPRANAWFNKAVQGIRWSLKYSILFLVHAVTYTWNDLELKQIVISLFCLLLLLLRAPCVSSWSQSSCSICKLLRDYLSKFSWLISFIPKQNSGLSVIHSFTFNCRIWISPQSECLWRNFVLMRRSILNAYLQTKTPQSQLLSCDGTVICRNVESGAKN